MTLLPIGLLVLLTVALLWLLQRRLIYFPAAGVPAVEDVLPGWRAVTLATQDGLRLEAWYSAPGRAEPVVIVLSGNAGNRADRAPLGSRLAAEGLGVLLVDYRGYGGNPGRPSETGLAEDARAAARFVAEREPGHPVVLFGESLGAAVAVELAATEPPAALILRSPFTSLADAANEHFPLVPARWLLRDRYPTDERIGAVRSPILIIAGSDDSIVPAAQSRTLHELAPEPKELVIILGADHNDADLLAGDELIRLVIGFIDEATAS